MTPSLEETPMKKLYLASALAGAMLFATAATAATTGEYENMCTMGLALGQDVPTDCSVNAEIDGKTYCFGDEKAKTLFMKDPKANLAKAETYYKSKH
jgi:YHS domain-containing protein